MEKLQKDQELLQAARATLEAETNEMVKVSNRLHDNLVKAMRLMWRQLLTIWAVVILLFIGYFFVISKPSPFRPAEAPESKTLEKLGSTSDNLVFPRVPPTQESRQSTPIPEWQGITGILEQIRTAQLKKDINLILDAYSPGFPNLDQKKENILKTWQQYDYLDMHFRVETIQKLNAHNLIVTVVWDIILQDVRSKKKSSLLKEFTIRLSDVSGKWLIQELIQGEKTSKLAAEFAE